MNNKKHHYNNKPNKDNIFANIEMIIDYVYSQQFPKILIEEKSKFLNNIENKIIEILKSLYKENELQFQKDLEIYEKKKEIIKARYESDFSLLNSEYKKYKKNNNKVTYLTKFRKHCANSEQIPVHKCSNNNFGKFIEIFKNINLNDELKTNKANHIKKNSSYVICTECSTCYMNSLIKIYCSFCKCEYCSSKLDENENENVLPATWKEYHCKPILVNEMMKCIKCDKILYINLVTKKLVCLNKKCNFSSNPHSIIWKCKMCKKEFRSSVKVFNPLEIRILQNEVWKCLIYKNNALPNKIYCCTENEKSKNIKYYHDKKCKGQLYKWNINGKEIIVCGLCHAVNFYEKFIWTCPICKLKFNYHGKIHRNENDKNKNLILKNSSKINLKNISLEKFNTDNKQFTNKIIKENDKLPKMLIKKSLHRHNYSSNIKIFTTDEDNDINTIKDKKYFYENNLSLASIEGNKTIDFNKNLSFVKNKDENLINIINTCNNVPKPKFSQRKKKKIRYQTLFDILEQREKYKISNQSTDENINKENLTNAKSKLDDYYNKKRIKLLENSKPKTSNKKEKKTLFQKYFTSNEKKNNLINNLINKKKINIKNNLGNNIINISDIEEKLDINNDDNYIHEYDSIKQNLKKKLSGDLYNNFSSSLIVAPPPEPKNSELQIFNFKDKIYSKRYKDEQATINNDGINKVIKLNKNSKSKNKSKKRDKSRINIDKKKDYLQESNIPYKLNNISVKQNVDKNIKRSVSSNNNYENDLKTNKSNQINIINEIENKENKNYNKYEISTEINNIKEKDNEEKRREKELILEKDKFNSTKLKKNQIFKRIFLNKIRQNSLKAKEKSHLFKEENNIIDIINEHNSSNNGEMKISPFGDICENIVSKDEFFKISNECKIPTFDDNNINYISPIGQGSYGVIYLVEENSTKKQYALKRVLCQDIEQILKQKKEFELSYSLNHPNFIKIHNVLFKYLDLTTYSLYVLMEKAETDWNTEIEKRIKTHNFYTESELISIMKQLVSVLYYFQKNNLAHRDIKPQNILICNNNIFKITDLGEAKYSENTSKLATLKGSQLFMSPNLYFVLKYDGSGAKAKHNVFKSDVFSLGYCFLYAMSLNLKLITSLREETSMFDVLSVMKKFGIENKFSEKFMNIIYKMIQTDENKRCDFLELKEEIDKNL